MKRYRDWMAQALRDLEHAGVSLRAGHYEWACFAAQQAAEKAVAEEAVRKARRIVDYVRGKLPPEGESA